MPNKDVRRILVTGRNGQVGHELVRSLACLGEVLAVDRQTCDLARPEQIEQTLASFRPTVIVNAAAYTAVDKAESEAEAAHAINARAPAQLAAYCAEAGALLIHFSTDYVFAGDGDQPHRPLSPIAPASVYGRTKAAGEAAITDSQCRHAILRTSWVFGAHGGNFLKTMLRLAQERDQLRVIDDQWGAPTPARLLADVVALVVAQGSRFTSGIYHVVPRGETTWCRYARFLLAEAQRLGVELRVSPNAVEAIPTSAYPTPARRPLNSRLDCQEIESALSINLPAWQLGVTQVLEDLLAR